MKHLHISGCLYYLHACLHKKCIKWSNPRLDPQDVGPISASHGNNDSHLIICLYMCKAKYKINQGSRKWKHTFVRYSLVGPFSFCANFW